MLPRWTDYSWYWCETSYGAWWLPLLAVDEKKCVRWRKKGAWRELVFIFKTGNKKKEVLNDGGLFSFFSEGQRRLNREWQKCVVFWEVVVELQWKDALANVVCFYSVLVDRWTQTNTGYDVFIDRTQKSRLQYPDDQDDVTRGFGFRGSFDLISDRWGLGTAVSLVCCTSLVVLSIADR